MLQVFFKLQVKFECNTNNLDVKPPHHEGKVMSLRTQSTD